MLPEGNEHALKHALAKEGPVSVAIDASNVSFQFYKQGASNISLIKRFFLWISLILKNPSGVYYEPNCSAANLDNGVLAVGSSEENGEKVETWTLSNIIRHFETGTFYSL